MIDGVMALEQEVDTYKAKLPEWGEHEGKFVLIHGADVVDFYTSYDDAIKVGYARFGLEPFLVKQVNRIEPVQFVSRLTAPQSLRRTG
jgi:hypothetical protein